MPQDCYRTSGVGLRPALAINNPAMKRVFFTWSIVLRLSELTALTYGMQTQIYWRMFTVANHCPPEDSDSPTFHARFRVWMEDVTMLKRLFTSQPSHNLRGLPRGHTSDRHSSEIHKAA
jgi:hypothetical protein